MVRKLIILGGIVASVVAVALIAIQRREATLLRAQEQELQRQVTEASGSIQQTTTSIVSATKTPAPSAELLRLRGQVGQLERRKRELSGVQPQNEHLRAQVANKGTNATGGIVLPPGYMRKAEARFVGNNTPEDTVQSLLWAIQNRDTASFLKMFDPEVAKQFEARIQSRGSAEEFFKEAESLPGMRIVQKKMVADGTVELAVEVLPGYDSKFPELRLKQFDGQWKIISGL